MEYLEIECWLIVCRTGAVKVRKSKPDLDHNEVPILLEVKVPQSLFSKPRLKASIEVPEENYRQNPITTEAINNIRDEIEHRTGLDFDVRLIEEAVEDGNSSN